MRQSEIASSRSVMVDGLVEIDYIGLLLFCRCLNWFASERLHRRMMDHRS